MGDEQESPYSTRIIHVKKSSNKGISIIKKTAQVTGDLNKIEDRLTNLRRCIVSTNAATDGEAVLISHQLQSSLDSIVQQVERGTLPDDLEYHDMNKLAIAIQKRSETVTSSWHYMHRLMKCAKKHLKYAAEYHQFFFDLQEVTLAMNININYLINKIPSDTSNASVMARDLEAFIESVKEIFEALEYWQSCVYRIFIRASSVVPVPLRTEKLTKPIWVETMTHFATRSDVRREARTDLRLIDNTDTHEWKLEDHAGKKVTLPSTLVFIPPPFQTAVDAANRLRAQLMTLWTTVVKKSAKRMFWLIIVLIKKWDKNEEIALRSMSDEERSSLLKVLSEFESIYSTSWEGHPGMTLATGKITELRNLITSRSRGGIPMTSSGGDTYSLTTSSGGNGFESVTSVITSEERIITPRNIDINRQGGEISSSSIRTTTGSRGGITIVTEPDAEFGSSSSEVLTMSSGSYITQKGTRSTPILLVDERRTLLELISRLRNLNDGWTYNAIASELGQSKEQLLMAESLSKLKVIHRDTILKMWQAQLQLEASENNEVWKDPYTIQIATGDPVEIQSKAASLTQHVHVETSSFGITGVWDSLKNDFISMDDAIRTGIINSADGVYINRSTRDRMTIEEAVTAQLIRISELQRQSTPEQERSFGLITIETKQDMQPYTLLQVWHPGKEAWISPREAIKRGVIEEGANRYRMREPTPGSNGDDNFIAMVEAINLGFVRTKNLETEGEKTVTTETKSLSRTYAVVSVVDHSKKDTVSYAEAVRSGIIDSETGLFTNNVTREKIDPAEAIRKGFLKVKMVSNPTKLDMNLDEKSKAAQRLAKLRGAGKLIGAMAKKTNES